MRIANFTDSFLPNVNGIAISISNSTRKLAEKGHVIKIFTSKIKGYADHNLGKNISVERFNYFKLRRWGNFYQFALPSKPDIMKSIDEFKPDIIHIHSPSIIGWQALSYAKKNNIPVVATYHAYLEGLAGHLPFLLRKFVTASVKLLRRYTRSFFNKSDVVIAPSKFIKDYLIKNGVIKRIEIISNGVDTKVFKPGKISKSGKNVLHVGRISYEKNVDVLLKSFSLASRYVSGLNLKIVGPGNEIQKLKELAKSLKLDNVSFLGKVEYRKLPEIYSKADMFVTASTAETEGLVILEAMASGLPVVGFDSVSLPYLVKNGKTGLLAKPYDEEGMARCLARIMTDSRLRREFSKNALEHSKIFSLDRNVGILERLYKRLARI